MSKMSDLAMLVEEAGAELYGAAGDNVASVLDSATKRIVKEIGMVGYDSDYDYVRMLIVAECNALVEENF